MKKIVDVRPVGSQVLVEMLTPQEALGTMLELGENTTPSSPQAYVLAFGPSFNAEGFGLKLGDRVVVQGHYTPLPKHGNTRDRGVLEPHNIKAVLLEQDD